MANWRKIQNSFKKQLSSEKGSQFNRIFDTPQSNWRAYIPQPEKEPKKIQYKYENEKYVQF